MSSRNGYEFGIESPGGYKSLGKVAFIPFIPRIMSCIENKEPTTKRIDR